MDDVLKDLDLGEREQELLIEDRFLIDLFADVPLREAKKITLELRIRDVNCNYGDWFEPVHVRSDLKFNSQTWSIKFGSQFEHVAILSLEEVQEVLCYCARISNLATYW